VVTSKSIPTPHRQWLNLAYATRSGYEKLDLYLPAHLPAHSRPQGLVVYVHGGGWLEPGNVKANFVSQTFVNFFLAAGYAIASINYRLSSEAHFPAQIQDVKTAVRWLRAHAAQYGYDPAEIAAMGDSAGGQLVALLGTSQGVPALEGTSLGYPGVSSSIKAAVVLYPDINLLADQTWLSQIPFCAGKYLSPNLPDSPGAKYLGAPVQAVPARARAADPMTYLTPGRPLPKFLIAQGTHDCTVPYQGSVKFDQALVKFAGPAAAQLILEPGKGHFSPPTEVNFNFTELIAPVIKLLRETIGPGQKAGGEH
jgi:acetyl esterase/lipase